MTEANLLKLNIDICLYNKQKTEKSYFIVTVDVNSHIKLTLQAKIVQENHNFNLIFVYFFDYFLQLT